MELHTLARIDEVDATAWNALNTTDYPFLDHGFLAALEEHGAVTPRTGWQPHHLALYDGDRLVAAAPAYLKGHSWGEFVFDFAWADAYERNGLDYYPKLLMAIPFTPATGPRMLVDPHGDGDALRDGLAAGARAVVDQLGLSSAHWLFPRATDLASLDRAAYSLRHGCQFHWYNPGYPDFEAFLAALTAKKRKNIRRERRRVREAGVRLRVVHGDEADGTLWDAFHRFYCSTFERRGNLPLISRDCFAALGDRLGARIVLIVAERDSAPIAGALCFRDQDTLYGRYWGCDEEVDGLHFEACYYQGIDYCIAHRLTRFEPGAQGEHKVARGFVPTVTRSAHYLADPRFRAAVDDFLERERAAVDDYARTLTMEGPYREETRPEPAAYGSG